MSHCQTWSSKLVLASQSPRRKMLLEQYGYDFEVVLPSESAESGEMPGEAPAELVVRHAFQKARDVAQHLTSGLILGSDTVAECEGQILGKPRDRNHAKQMLQLMQGKRHQVLSGVCLWERPADQVLLELEKTELMMESFTDSDLESYLDTNAWKGKAGAFGFQDGLDWVRIVEGSESNVVGLPMERLAEMLNRFQSEARPHQVIAHPKWNIR